VHYVPTDKINASIRIRQILKVKIGIQQMQILTSFVISLTIIIIIHHPHYHHQEFVVR